MAYTAPQVTTEPRMAFFWSLMGKLPSSTMAGTHSKPKYGVMRNAQPMIQPTPKP